MCFKGGHSMSAKRLIQLLEKHLHLHKGLLQLANKKTEILKKGDIKALNSIMKEEQKYIALINQNERERINIVEDMISKSSNPKQDPTLTTCIELTEEPERLVLDKLKNEISTVVLELKNANLLNQQLIQQSLQLVNILLDMFKPQPQEINYGRTNTSSSLQYISGRSRFDSKA
jgi:flagellar biosynthesis/type III secretory pathway chaperone